MSREIDPRQIEPERPGLGEPREVFSRDLDLPRGMHRTRVQVRDHSVELTGSQARILATAGAFRVVPASDLRDPSETDSNRIDRDVRHLAEVGLVQTRPYVAGRTRTTLITLTDEGRDLLEDARRPTGGREQQYYAGFIKPRELAHDSRVYAAYLRSAERIVERGGRIRRVVLDYELKRDYQRFLHEQSPDRAGRRDAARDAADVDRWAHEHGLSVVDGHVLFPDVRVEYDERDGRERTEDIEVTTPHYRGAQLAGKGRAGFTCYRAGGARLGGGGGGFQGKPRR